MSRSNLEDFERRLEARPARHRHERAEASAELFETKKRASPPCPNFDGLPFAETIAAYDGWIEEHRRARSGDLVPGAEPAAEPAAPPPTIPTEPECRRGGNQGRLQPIRSLPEIDGLVASKQLNIRLRSGRRTTKEMVRIPAGTFLYGEEKRERELPEFWIDKTPVTNAEYARFVEATDYKPPEHWKGQHPPDKIADHPVTYVSWHDAVAYAEWAGKRLPTKEEWEKAARGLDGRIYPWGEEEPTPELCNYGKNEGGTTPVGKYSPQGDSPYGCAGMAGNVWEWTASDHERGGKVLRGGWWNDNSDLVRCAFRFGDGPVDSRVYYGFRCARSSR